MVKKDESDNCPSTSISCSVCGLRKLCLANGLSVAAIKALESVLRNHDYRRGEHAFRTGDDFQYLYTIKSGTVKNYITAIDGTEQVIGFHYPGEMIGLDALFGHKHTSSAVFLDNAKACVLPYDRFDALSNKDPELHHAIEMQFSGAISQYQELLMIINNKTAEQRVSIFLLDYSFRLYIRGLSRETFYLSMSRAEIGSYLGLAAETVSRILTKFERKGIITVHKKKLHIRDIQSLDRYVDTCKRCSALLIEP